MKFPPPSHRPSAHAQVHESRRRTGDQKGVEERQRRIHMQSIPGIHHYQQHQRADDPAEHPT